MPIAAGNLHQGHGGKISVGTDQDLNIAEWSFTKKRDQAEVTHSGSQGWRQRLHTLRDSSGQFSMPWDDAITPEAAGFDIDDSGTLKMYLGDSGKAYTVLVLFGECQFKCSNREGVVELVVPWVGNGPVTGPT